MHLVANFDQPAVDRGLSAVDLIARSPRSSAAAGAAGRPWPVPAAGTRTSWARRWRPRRPRSGTRCAARHEGARDRLWPGPHRDGGERRDRRCWRGRVGVVEKVRTAAGMRARCCELIAEQEPELVVVGLPLTLRGEHGEQAKRDARLRARPARALPGARRDIRRALHHHARHAAATGSQPDDARGRRPPARGISATARRLIVLLVLVARSGAVYYGVRTRAARLVEADAGPARAADRGRDPARRDGGDIGSILRAGGVVADGGRFRNYAKDQGQGTDFQAGSYRSRRAPTTT